MRFELQIAGVVSSAVRFPGGMIFFVELQLSLTGENPDGSRTEISGRGYFPRSFNGAVTVKDTRPYHDTDDWGNCNCHHYELKVKAASAAPKSEYEACQNGKCKKNRRGDAVISNVKQLKPPAIVTGAPGLGETS